MEPTPPPPPAAAPARSASDTSFRRRIVVRAIFLLLTLGIYRVVLEAFMVIFRIYEEMKKIREGNESQS